MHIVFDWDGTIVKKFIAEEAAVRRNKSFGLNFSREWVVEQQKSHIIFQSIRDEIKKRCGITDSKKQTRILTTFFLFHYLSIVNELKEKAFQENMLEVLKQIKKENPEIKFSIFTFLIQDLIDECLNVLEIKNLFDHVYGNSSELVFSKKDLAVKALKDCKEIHLVVGDRLEDIAAGKQVKATTVATAWGQHNHEELDADFVIHSPGELIKIIDALKK